MNTFLDKLGHVGQVMVSMLVISAFLACIGGLFYCTLKGVDLTGGVKEVLLVLIGVLAGAFKDVCGFWIGSSLSSAKKDSTIAGAVRP